MKQWRIGIAGLGVVGAELARMLLGQSEGTGGSILDSRLEHLSLRSISARDRDRDRGFTGDGLEWFDDPVDLARSPEIDIFVELIGGDRGIAGAAVRAALDSGKHVVTANKALLAAEGAALAVLAEARNVTIGYEAAVAGGIPIIHALKNATAACSVVRVAGILNGTCNYILSQMEAHGAEFDEALKEAQKLGFAEADPSLDIEGDDAAHKLALLAAVSFGIWPTGIFAKTQKTGTRDLVEGITAITARDIEAASALGHRIRLLGVAEKLTEHGQTEYRLSVRPYAVQADRAFARAMGPDNHVMITGAPLGTLNLTGPGAGGGPTASAVASDILAITGGETGPVFGRPAAQLLPITVRPAPGETACFMVRIENAAANRNALLEQMAAHDIKLARHDQIGRDFIALTGRSKVASVKDFIDAIKGGLHAITALRIAEF